MGKYTSLARQLREEDHNKEVINNKSVKINNIGIDTDSNISDQPSDGATPLRPYAVNAVVQCIHGTTPDACLVCNGYTRWLVEDEGRFRRARDNPEEVRREFWRSARRP